MASMTSMASMAKAFEKARRVEGSRIAACRYQAPDAAESRSTPTPTKSLQVAQEQGSQKKEATSSCPPCKITDSSSQPQSILSSEASANLQAVINIAMAMANNDEYLSNGEMDVDADQGTTSSSTAVSEDSNEFRGSTNFVPRHGSYRVSHEKGSVHYAIALDFSDLFDDEDDSLYDEDGEDTIPPSQ